MTGIFMWVLSAELHACTVCTLLRSPWQLEPLQTVLQQSSTCQNCPSILGLWDGCCGSRHEHFNFTVHLLGEQMHRQETYHFERKLFVFPS